MGKPSILVVDDVELNLVLLEAQLSQLDCEVVRARNGSEALTRLGERDFAVMILDVQMPEMDGYEVARLARENPRARDLPLIFVTGEKGESNMKRGYDVGAVDFLPKPVNGYVLTCKVRVFLDLHLARQRLANEVAAHKQTSAELESFSYSVAHDLRTPLRSIDGFSQALLEDFSERLDDEGRRYLGKVRASVQRMGRLIDDLLSLARVTRSELKQTEVDLSGIARSIADRLLDADAGRTAEFAIAEGVRAEGDAGLLTVALENLLGNAWKFTAKREQPRIEFGQRDEAGMTVYFVRDNGAGFDMTYAGKLFGTFERLHSADEFEGTGIGLCTVQRIVHRHGGEIWAQGEVGRGATFEFTLGTLGDGAAR
jgi:signal transduction histidine kinase